MPYSLTGLIEKACNPKQLDPNLAINLEICETINKKQGNSPRVAAETIVRLVNSSNMTQALLALTLLDNCVKNCGYPFHLQIASKDFLNALVSKFPARPITRYAPNPVQSAPENQWNHFDYIPTPHGIPNPVLDRILYLIKEWKVALTELSRYKEDMAHIRDMYRLLKFKGYQFPELRESSIAALVPNDVLKSAKELEEEDRVIKSAKLQELIRRGKPQDLVEANKLMKIMTGYDQKHQTDFTQKFSEELHRIQNKANLLYEMLDNMRKGDRIVDDTMEELKNSCMSAMPKIRKMLNEEKDGQKLDDLNELNSMINAALLKYNDIKKGIYDTKYDIKGKSTNTMETSSTQPISLIDLDDQIDSPSASTSKENPLDEISDIFGTTHISSSSPSFDILPHNSSISSPNMQSDLFSTDFAPPSGSQATPNNSIELVNKNGLVIDLDILSTGKEWAIKAYFTNKSSAAMDNMVFMLAVPKIMRVSMSPISSHSIPPKSSRTVHQNIHISNENNAPLRLRYKVTYNQFDVQMEQSGEYRE
ncbi:hypothetical protein BDB01DRAFT_845572 [Pilobolus umbonatus]|nr:hypothetical protein BDB01DRAFT_845572 [Pilobolus umbonatus]